MVKAKSVISALASAGGDGRLLGALAVVEASTSDSERAGLLVAATERFGEVERPAVMRRLTRIVTKLARENPDVATGLAEDLSSIRTASASWCRAQLLSKAGDASAALESLAGGERVADDDARSTWFLERAKLAAAVNDVEGRTRALVQACRSARSFRLVSACERHVERLRSASLRVPVKRRMRVALLGSETQDFFASALRVAAFGWGLDVQVFVGGFGQYRQEILAPDSLLSGFSPDAIILATDWREFGFDDVTDDVEGTCRARVDELRGLWSACRDRYDAFVLQHSFDIPAFDSYGRMSATIHGGRVNLLRRLNLELVEAAAAEQSVAVIDAEQASALFGKVAYHDPSLWHSAKQHPAPDALSTLAIQDVAVLRAVAGLTAKVAVLDLDGTLWGGVIGEDGLEGIRLGGTGEGEAYVAFQRYLKSLTTRGVVLAVCSKNNEGDAKLPFREHPEMVLTEDDFGVFVANWETKDANLRTIAEVLNLGLDSFVFVDDNPTERAWVREQLPDVEVPELPADPALYVSTLARQPYFEGLDVTDEDRARADSYRQNAQRRLLEVKAPSLEEFLRGLQMHVTLKAFAEEDMPRIAQLVNKTNQFNLTTRRRSEAQLRALEARGDTVTLSMRVSDRFGDSGLTGLMIGLAEDGELRIDTFLMSCRVLGRRIEEIMMSELEARARGLGCTALIGEYLPTEKNGQVRDLYERLGFDVVEEHEDGRRLFRKVLSDEPSPPPEWVQVELAD